MIESYFDSELNKWVPERELNALAKALPFVRGELPVAPSVCRSGSGRNIGRAFK